MPAATRLVVHNAEDYTKHTHNVAETCLPHVKSKSGKMGRRKGKY